MATNNDWLMLMGTLEIAFGKQPNGRQEFFIQRLADQPFESVCAAVSKCIDECKFYPTIADILERLPAVPDPKIKALQAWQRVLKAATSEIYVSHNPHTGTTPTGERLDAIELACAGGPNGLARIRDMYCSDGDLRSLGYEKIDFITQYTNATEVGARPLLAYKGETKRLGGCAPRMIGTAVSNRLNQRDEE